MTIAVNAITAPMARSMRAAISGFSILSNSFVHINLSLNEDGRGKLATFSFSSNGLRATRYLPVSRIDGTGMGILRMFEDLFERYKWYRLAAAIQNLDKALAPDHEKQKQLKWMDEWDQEELYG
ncbi:hypothetical protein VTN77DRAFT_8113 [Rasamsonia byssochlamydoides]|uniref:uncharacterized protein n=1 Tax=Rasamsonia byssochlamydoides TaxID=89139 RepID=UPI003743BDFF